MINILDNNSLIWAEKNNLRIEEKHSCLVTKEVKAEFVVMENQEAYLARCGFLSVDIDFPIYLQEYKRILNTHSLLSFYNLKGIGDVSILASACALARASSQANSLFPNINIVTEDKDLRKAVFKETQTYSSIMTQPVADWSESVQ